MIEKCKACKRDIEEYTTHNRMCNKCLWSNRKPRIIKTKIIEQKAIIEEIY